MSKSDKALDLKGQRDFYPEWEKLVDEAGGAISAPELAKRIKARRLYDPDWLPSDPVLDAILPRVDRFLNEKFAGTDLAKFTQIRQIDSAGFRQFKRTRQLTFEEWAPAVRDGVRRKVNAQLRPLLALYQDGHSRGFRLTAGDVPKYFRIAYDEYKAGKLKDPDPED